MNEKPLAAAHRQVGKAEHAVEEQLLQHADPLPDPDQVRRRAHTLSKNADKHLSKADALDEAPPR